MKRLIIRPGAIGDCIVSLPALEHLAVAGSEVWVNRPNVPLIRFADCVKPIAATGLDLLELHGPEHPVFATLQQFDSIVSWYGSSRAEFRDAVSSLPFVFHPALPTGNDIHAVDFYSRQVGLPDGLVPAIRVARKPSQFIAIQPFSGGRSKNWPLSRFQDLAQQLPVRAEFCVGPEEHLDGAKRIDDLWELAQWLAGAAAYVGNDSGISHLAAAVGLPTVVVFRTTNPAVWAPRGRRVSILTGDPSTGEVLRAVNEILSS